MANMKFNCHCQMHILTCDKKPLSYKGDYIAFTIYEHRSGYTGKLFKKPKEKGTVVLVDKEAKKFYKWVALNQ